MHRVVPEPSVVKTPTQLSPGGNAGAQPSSSREHLLSFRLSCVLASEVYRPRSCLWRAVASDSALGSGGAP